MMKLRDAHPNTRTLMRLAEEADKLGFYDVNWPHRDFCYAVARESGETGDNYPSDNALAVAAQMLRDLKDGEKWRESNE